jgi:drug/metabolite transporter (DMT)-like permease
MSRIMTSLSDKLDPVRAPRLPKATLIAIGAVGLCAVIWGTTWYGITWQLGVVEPIVSVTWRFGLAALVLFAGIGIARQPMGLGRRQHLEAAGQGAFTFAVSYAFTYQSEQHVPSAIVAVIFAALAFLNLSLFRVAERQKAHALSWAGAALGVVGVAVLSGSELLSARLGPQAALGIGFAVIAVTSSAFGNLFAWRAQRAGAPLLASTAWAMAYGTAMLAIWGLATGAEFRVEPTAGYLISLVYLAVLGSVVAFVVYFWIARTRGYALASYISALTPPIAMLVSVTFENARFGIWALVGLAVVIAGQALMIRAARAKAA